MRPKCRPRIRSGRTGKSLARLLSPRIRSLPVAMPSGLVVLLAATCGLITANLYYVPAGRPDRTQHRAAGHGREPYRHTDFGRHGGSDLRFFASPCDPDQSAACQFSRGDVLADGLQRLGQSLSMTIMASSRYRTRGIRSWNLTGRAVKPTPFKVFSPLLP